MELDDVADPASRQRMRMSEAGRDRPGDVLVPFR